VAPIGDEQRKANPRDGRVEGLQVRPREGIGGPEHVPEFIPNSTDPTIATYQEWLDAWAKITA